MSKKKQAPKRVSIVDVAHHAGVSLGTVSNVLNRPERVSAPIREQVQAAIKALGFVPSNAARSLRTGDARMVGSIVLNVANPFFTDMVRGAEDRLENDGYTMMLASSDENLEREARYLRLFEENTIRGLLISPTNPDPTPLLELQKRGTPVVMMDSTTTRPELSYVAVDDVDGGRQVGEHLIGLGHERITFINGPHSIPQCYGRHLGLVAAMQAAGLDPQTQLDEVTILRVNARRANDCVTELLAQRRIASALFCMNDMAALGALSALRNHNVSVPGDVAVVGYDDVVFARELAVPLTSVQQPTRMLGYRAAELLLEQPNEPQHILFQPQLVPRASTLGR